MQSLKVPYCFFPWGRSTSKPNQESYAAFTHAGLTTRYRTKGLYKSMFVLPRSHDI